MWHRSTHKHGAHAKSHARSKHKVVKNAIHGRKHGHVGHRPRSWKPKE